MSDIPKNPRFEIPPIPAPKDEWVRLARKVIEAKGQVKLSPEETYNLARETLRYWQATQGLNQFLEQLTTYGKQLEDREQERNTSDDLS